MNKEKNQNDTIEIADLEPVDGVKGGIANGGPGQLILPATNTSVGVTERTGTLIYSGESGGLNG